MSKNLELAAAALARGAPAEALEPLVSEWRAVKVPSLADLIDAVSAQAAAPGRLETVSGWLAG